MAKLDALQIPVLDAHIERVHSKDGLVNAVEFGSASLWSQRLGMQICQAGSVGYWPLLTSHGQQPSTRLSSNPV